MSSIYEYICGANGVMANIWLVCSHTSHIHRTLCRINATTTPYISCKCLFVCVCVLHIYLDISYIREHHAWYAFRQTDYNFAHHLFWNFVFHMADTLHWSFSIETTYKIIIICGYPHSFTHSSSSPSPSPSLFFLSVFFTLSILLYPIQSLSYHYYHYYYYYMLMMPRAYTKSMNIYCFRFNNVSFPIIAWEIGNILHESKMAQ